MTKGTPKLLEHNDARWLTKDELNDINWIPADLTIIDYLKRTMEDRNDRQKIGIGKSKA